MVSGKDVRKVAERKHRYRRILLILLLLAVTVGGICGYRNLERSIPDKVYVTEGEGPDRKSVV